MKNCCLNTLSFQWNIDALDMPICALPALLDCFVQRERANPEK